MFSTILYYVLNYAFTAELLLLRYRKPDKGEGYEQRRRWPLEQLTVCEIIMIMYLISNRTYKKNATNFLVAE